MTFKDVAMKNFKVNIKKYLMCFLCSTFSIMIFFMYSSLLFNDCFSGDTLKKEGLNLLMYISMFAIIVFAAFFINYANNSFLKSRYKEFGVMMTLGMNKKDIRKLILIENIVIIISSLIIGIITGLLFSRLFQMVVIDLLGLDDIEYKISIKPFIFTIIVFAVIFLLEIIITIFATKKFSIEELIKKDRMNEGKLETKILPGIIGTVILVSSIIVLSIIGDNEKLRSNLIFSVGTIIAMFISVYIIISSFGMSLLAITKRFPKIYCNNIIVITNINKKFNSQKKVLFILTLLSTLTVFAIAPSLSLMNECKSVVDLNKYDLEIASCYGIDTVNENEIQKIATKYNIKIENKSSFQFLSCKFKSANGGTDITSLKPIISESEYNKNSDYKVKVAVGEAIKLITSWVPDTDKIIKGDTVTLYNQNDNISVKIKGILSQKWLSNDSVFPTESVLVLSDKDYNNLKIGLNEAAIGTCYQYNLSKWVNEDKFAQEIKKSLKCKNMVEGNEYFALKEQYFFMAKPLLYKNMIQGYRFFVFITVIIGILFFIASASILFFNQYIELDINKKMFYKLYKIGIVEKEINTIVSKELLITFFIPVIIGGILATILMNFTAKVMGGSNMLSDFMRSAYKVIGVYFISQVVFYIFTKYNYLRKLKY